MGNLLASCGLKRSTKIGSTTDYQSDSSDDATVLLGRGSKTAQDSSLPPVSAGARGESIYTQNKLTEKSFSHSIFHLAKLLHLYVWFFKLIVDS